MELLPLIVLLPWYRHEKTEKLEEENFPLAQCHFVHHKWHRNIQETNPNPSGDKPGTNSLCYDKGKWKPKAGHKHRGNQVPEIGLIQPKLGARNRLHWTEKCSIIENVIFLKWKSHTKSHQKITGQDKRCNTRPSWMVSHNFSFVGNAANFNPEDWNCFSETLVSTDEFTRRDNPEEQRLQHH